MLPLQDDNPTSRTPVVTYAIIAVNVLVFLWTLALWTLALSPQDSNKIASRYGLVPARVTQLFTGKPIIVREEEGLVYDPQLGEMVPQLRVAALPPAPAQTLSSMLTCMFFHAGWLHLLGNMWFLWIFGDNVEDRLGPLRYLLLYLGGGILAMLAHSLHVGNSMVPAIGASGAVAVILGAYAVTWPWARVRTLIFLVIFFTIVDLPALAVLGAWFLIQLVAGVQPTPQGAAAGVAWWAHIGGFAVGMALMPLLASPAPPITGSAGNEFPPSADPPYA